MKIGIMTIPFNNNYGGFLQAFALKYVLTQMGHKVTFVMRRRNYQRMYTDRWKNLVSYLLRRQPQCQFLMDYRQRKLNKYTSRFINKYLKPWTRECYRSYELDKLLNLDIDLYIAGSDQCWRSKFAPDYIDDYYFRFLKGSGKKRISYAASFGTDEFEYSPEMQKSCSELLKEFSAISVRESSGITLMEKYFDVPKGFAMEVLDPTMLPSVDVYRKMIDDYPITENNYLFTYILDESGDKHAIIDEILKAKGLTEVNQKAQTGDVSKLKPIEPVELWLSRIQHADFIVTDSFHGTVFSILFNKPFIAYGNPARGSARFKTLLCKCGLESRYIDNKQEFTPEILTAPIDWQDVNDRLSKLKAASLEYLSKAIEV